MKKKKNLLARKENLLAQLNFWWPRAEGRRLMRRLGKAEFPSNLNCEQKSLLKQAPGPGCVQCEVIYLYYQVEAEAELRGWQGFRGWARKENLLAQLNFWWPRAEGRRLMRRLGKAEFPSNLNCEQKSLLKQAPGPGCVQCEVIYLYYQVEAEAELRGWQGFRGWAQIRIHAETTDHSRKLASVLVSQWRRSGHVTRFSAWLIPHIFLK